MIQIVSNQRVIIGEFSITVSLKHSVCCEFLEPFTKHSNHKVEIDWSCHDWVKGSTFQMPYRFDNAEQKKKALTEIIKLTF